jgi:CRP-like cAMP-binding protein
MATPRGASPSNLLVDALPLRCRRALFERREPVELRASHVLSEPGQRTREVLFPIEGFVSLIAPIDAHSQIEVSLVGNEGMLGVCLALGVNTAALRSRVQGAGWAWQVDAAVFRRELARSPAMQRICHRYAFVLLSQFAQTAACTHFHFVEARLAKWLLMTRDRAHADSFCVTHELLGLMLGVRRVGVTTAASALQRRELIRYRRGNVEIIDGRGLELAACECYAKAKRTYAQAFERTRGTKPRCAPPLEPADGRRREGAVSALAHRRAMDAA